MESNIKNKILSYSIEALQSKGIKAVTLKNITENCHISRSTFYQYFDSKEALLEEIQKSVDNCDAISVKEQILQAAVEAFSKNPYTEVDIVTIAKAVNMQRSSVYRYFPTKENLFEESLKMELENRMKFYRNMNIYSVDFKTALAIFFDYMADFRTNPYKNLTFFEALAYSQHNETVKNSLKALWSNTEKSIQQVLHHGKETGELKKDFSVETYSKMILSFVGGSAIFSSDHFASLKESFIDMIYHELQSDIM